MKKIVIFLLFVFTFFSTVSAYEPTEEETKILSLLKQNFERKWNIKWELWLKRHTYILQNALTKTDDERVNYILNHILNDVNLVLDDVKKVNEEKLRLQLEEQKKKKEEELKLITDYKEKSKIFFETHGSSITTSLNISENCTKYFDFIDEIAKKNDFPTELIIATWSKEYNCNLWNPANGWWPFQITSQYYTPWDISLEQFWESVQKYIDFTKGKWNYFNNNTYHNYKTRFWNENIAITYDNYTIRDLKISAILYNWVNSTTTLDWNSFANANLNNSVTSNSDWLVTRFLKILNWRINNK